MTSTKPAQPKALPDISISGSTSSLSLLPGLEPASSSFSSTNTRSAANETPLLEHGPRFRTSPVKFLRKFSLFVSGTEWRSYDNYVGRRIFYSGFDEEMKSAVMANPLLQAKVSELAKKRVLVEEQEGGIQGSDARTRRREELGGQISEVAAKMTDGMICKMDSKAFVRWSFYFTTQLMTRTYNNGIHVSSDEVLRLRAVAEETARKGQSIVFLPSHRSHIDYISLQIICYRLGLSLPTVIAGDNLNFPVIGTFLQHVGAAFIRRQFGEDQLYTTVVQAYIDVLLQKGLNLECFIEGSRSRTGKLLPPKYGFLSFLLDSIMSGRVDDAMICPVSTQYDKVIEVDSYVREMLGRPKPKEDLKGFLSASSVLNLKLGCIDVRFHEPWSLRAFIQDQETRLSNLTTSDRANLQQTYNKNLRTRLLRTLGYKVLSDINAASVIMPTALIGTVLLTHRARGLSKTELIRRVEWLSERVRAHGGRVAHFAGLPTADIVARGVEVLGPKLVGVRKDDVAEETYEVVDAFQMSFYRNMTIHLFIAPAVVCAAMYSHFRDRDINPDLPQTQRMPYTELKSKVLFLSQLFRAEFIFPMAGLLENLDTTLAGLETDGIVAIDRSPVHTSTATTTTATNPILSIFPSESESEQALSHFYTHLLWPFIETYWLGALSLLLLSPPPSSSPIHNLMSSFSSSTSTPPSISIPTFLSHAQLLGRTLHAQGSLTYLEAINKETLSNTLARLEEDGVVVVDRAQRGEGAQGGEGAQAGEEKGKGKGKGAASVRLTDAWIPVRDGEMGGVGRRGRLWDLVERVGGFRREGRGREKGTGREVVRAVDLVAGMLWRVRDVEGGGAVKARL